MTAAPNQPAARLRRPGPRRLELSDGHRRCRCRGHLRRQQPASFSAWSASRVRASDRRAALLGPAGGASGDTGEVRLVGAELVARRPEGAAGAARRAGSAYVPRTRQGAQSGLAGRPPARARRWPCIRGGRDRGPGAARSWAKRLDAKPDLRAVSARLSGGQQQRMALAMAFCGRARADRARRADDRPGRDDPAPGTRHGQEAVTRLRRRGGLRLARSGRGRRDGQPGSRDVRGPDSGLGPDGQGVRRPAPPLYPRAAARGAVAGRDRAADRDAPGSRRREAGDARDAHSRGLDGTEQCRRPVPEPVPEPAPVALRHSRLAPARVRARGSSTSAVTTRPPAPTRSGRRPTRAPAVGAPRSRPGTARAGAVRCGLDGPPRGCLAVVGESGSGRPRSPAVSAACSRT